MDKYSMNPLDTKPKKAGALIYCKNPKPLILLLKSSNPMFGGSSWQLPKGHIDEGESPHDTGVREGKEETGLMNQDIKDVHDIGIFTFTGMIETYEILFVGIETYQPKVSGKYHFETGEIKWFTIEDAKRVIRKDQLQVLQKIFK